MTRQMSKDKKNFQFLFVLYILPYARQKSHQNVSTVKNEIVAAILCGNHRRVSFDWNQLLRIIEIGSPFVRLHLEKEHGKASQFSYAACRG
ncbi:unnamed protein product [Hermetia illucens]|uniref:Uncharacterized protein n=1 Tax=Hermetia illucens TaxID=343691 RepID=A0A7R8UUX6_HERIL|nr:unnamed protein product [Hermetia illucens]